MPPQRRLISIADSSQAPSRPHGDEVDGAAPDHALACQPSADLQRLDRDLRRVLRVGGEAAAEVGLPVRAAEHLVVRREDVDLARGADPELGARAPQVLALDPLLHDPALAGEGGEVVEDGGLGVLERERGAECALVERERHVDEGVAEAADAAVELHDRRRAAQLAQRLQHVALAGDVEAAGVRHVLVGEDAPAAGLRPQPLERGIGAVERDPEANGELDLVR